VISSYYKAKDNSSAITARKIGVAFTPDGVEYELAIESVALLNARDGGDSAGKEKSWDMRWVK